MSRPLTPDTLVYGLILVADPQVAPDGTQLVYIRAEADPATQRTSSHLWLCAIDGNQPRRLTWGGTRHADPRWSPDGQWLAFSADREPGPVIYLLPMASPGEARPIARHSQPAAGLAWAPDSRRLAYTALVDPDNLDEAAPPADAPAPVRVVRRLDYKQDGRGLLNDTRTQVFVVDVASGSRRQLTREPFDHDEPQWSPDGRWLAVQVPAHTGNNSQLRLIEVDTGATRRVGPAAGVVTTWAWAPDGTRLLFAGDIRPSGQTDFFLYHLADASIRRLTDDLPCLPAAGFPTLRPSHPLWLDDRRALFHAFRAGASGLYALDTATGAVETVQTWPALHDLLSTDRDRRVFAQMRASPEGAGEIMVTERATGRTWAVAQPNAPLLREHPPARWERFDVRRGPFTVEGWLLKPPGFDPARRYPVVLDIHGGPQGFYGYGFRPVQQCLATHGFLVVYCNPRGSTTYGRAFAQQVVGDWGGEDACDLLAVLDVALARPYADAARVGIYGYSYGGYMVAWLIGQQPGRFRAAVCGAPVFDLESLYGTCDEGYILADLEWGGPPHLRREWYAARSPATFAHQARTPTLILHGEADESCPIGQSEQMFVALKQAGCAVEFARYPSASHGFLNSGPPAYRFDALQRILGWFQAHLG